MSVFSPVTSGANEWTRRFPRREDVERANRERMEKLDGEVHTFASTDGGTADPRSRDNILNNFMAPKELKLKVDAQVHIPFESLV